MDEFIKANRIREEYTSVVSDMVERLEQVMRQTENKHGSIHKKAVDLHSIMVEALLKAENL